MSATQSKPLAFPCDNSTTTAYPTTSVTWSTNLGLGGDGGEIPPTVSSLVGDNNVTLGSTFMGSSPDHLARTPHKPNPTAPFNHSQPSYVTQPEVHQPPTLVDLGEITVTPHEYKSL